MDKTEILWEKKSRKKEKSQILHVSEPDLKPSMTQQKPLWLYMIRYDLD
jgi:hypothetical protein